MRRPRTSCACACVDACLCVYASENQSTALFGDHPFSIKHPQDNFSLQNVNWHPPKCKLTPSKKGIGDLQSAVFVYKYTEISPRQFTFWRASICILEAEIFLGVLCRKGGTPKKGGTLASPQYVCVYVCVCVCRFSWTRSECDACPSGQFAQSGGLSACSKCWNGTFAAYPGATHCEPCMPGQVQATPGPSWLNEERSLLERPSFEAAQQPLITDAQMLVISTNPTC